MATTPPPKPDLTRDLDHDGDVDLADDRSLDLNHDGRIDTADQEAADLDHDHDIDAADELLKEEQTTKSVGASLGWNKGGQSRQRPDQGKYEQGEVCGAGRAWLREMVQSD